MLLISVGMKNHASNNSNGEECGCDEFHMSFRKKLQFCIFWYMLCKQKLEVNVIRSSGDPLKLPL